MVNSSLAAILRLMRAQSFVEARVDPGLGAVHGLALRELMFLMQLDQAPLNRLRRVDLANRLAGTVREDAWTPDAAHAWWDQHRLNEHQGSIRGAAADKPGSGPEGRRRSPRLDSDAGMARAFLPRRG